MDRIMRGTEKSGRPANKSQALALKRKQELPSSSIVGSTTDYDAKIYIVYFINYIYFYFAHLDCVMLSY